MSVADTNILVHVTDPSSPGHAPARNALASLMATGPVAVTRQIMREYLSVMTRPQAHRGAFPFASALTALEQRARQFRILEDGAPVWAELRTLARTLQFAGKQVHDANIVATMLAHGETRLLTCNVRDFRRFEPLIEVLTP